MSVLFNGQEIFGDGPQRCAVGPLGEYVLPYAAVNPYQAGSTPVGPLELTITVTGRMVAESEEDLWALRDAAAAQLAHPPVTGTLVDTTGREWVSMSFIKFVSADRRDRGREFSLGFTATFVRFLA